ncbi:ABC transporter ATP-binding protein [Actinocorallia sp. A-T 12471]|uniref:ABC transporter ATP-binding protein n=1 Tax=Actinocorallia sp. A-T 12471 TaxID=3089813 RepID=UPI0029CE4EEC|nr:ABC transporter ATP-binding protein [Actinocorallia sp. A-T 12471]MDX6744181.1 ABC transporter ATP-binding protein [Actinocorallia sp. A-T 12471]
MTEVGAPETDLPQARPADAVPRLEVRDVSVSFTVKGKRRTILEGVSCEIARDEIVGIVGRSGTGKTTLLNLLGGILRPSGGGILLDGEPFDKPVDKVITVFQDYNQALLPWRTVRRNVSLGIERRLTRAEVTDRVDRALEMTHLTDNANDLPWQLSGGMQQRVQIARALVMEPEVLLLDEPFGALDAMTRATLQDDLLRLQRETGFTVVFITHDVDEAVYLADRVLVLGGSPANVVREVVSGLPSERDQLDTRESPLFTTARRTLADELWGEGR